MKSSESGTRRNLINEKIETINKLAIAFSVELHFALQTSNRISITNSKRCDNKLKVIFPVPSSEKIIEKLTLG